MSTLQPDQWEAVSPYLDQALTLPESERAAWLASLRVQNRELADRIEALLAEHQALAGEGFLDRAPLPPAAEPKLAGQTIGAYTLISPVGFGGMGTVWLAERSDGRFKRRAAVKFLNLAVAGPSGEERFKREGSILARLEHPNIAGLIDAGVSAEERPYLILEYVEGEHIDRYCDENRLDVSARLRLFLDVFAAVAHAHANLIVHRDLKPSNVLVRKDGEVKLLDFGIAKLLEAEQQPSPTMLTQEGGGALTPAYAAPEQVKGEPVTTATDVYALGVLLHVLLTGQHPAGAATRSPAELVKAIVETEPPPASHALNPAKDAKAANLIAANRGTTPDKLARVLRGDLDTIITKALKKNPKERYTSVTAFADDIRRYLAHEPISARPDTFVYRTRKFLRRHWLPVAAAALVIATLSASLYEVNRERVISQRRFLEVRQLANKLFDIDVQVRELSGSTKTRQFIVDTALEYLRRVAADVRGDPDLALEVGNAYLRVARVQGVPIGPNLGQEDKAEQNLQIAQGFVDSVLKAQPRNRTAMLRAAQIAHDRMILSRFREQHEETLALANSAAQWIEKFHAGKDDVSEAAAILNVHLNVADQFGDQQQYEQALRLCDRGTELARMYNSSSQAGTFLWAKAGILRQQGDLDAALKAARESIVLLDPGPDGITQLARSSNFLSALIREGRILGEVNSVSLGQSAEALKPLERAYRIADELVHRDPNEHSLRGRLATAGISISSILRHTDAKRALEISDHTLHHLAEIPPNVNFQRSEVSLLAGSSYALRELGRSAEARERLEQALVLLKQMKFYPAETISPESEAAEVLHALADQEAGTGNVRGAIQMYEDLLARMQPARSGLQPDLEAAVHFSTLYGAASALYQSSGDTTKAVLMQTRRLELWRQWKQKLPNNAFVQRQLEAAALPPGTTTQN
jgi:serine/threonine-protein kinase